MKKMYSCWPALFLTGWLLLLGTSPVEAQFLWQRQVNTSVLQETGEFMTPVAGGFVMLGKSSSPVPQGLYMSKVNYQGDTVWTRRIRFPWGNGVYARGVIEDRAGNLVVSASLFDSNYVPSRSSGGLAKLTPAGDTLWTRLTGDGINTLVLGNDGNYVLASDVKTAPLLTMPTIFKYSLTGALVWSRPLPYSSALQGYLYTMAAVPNGYVVQSLPNSGYNTPSKFITVNEAGIYQTERPGSQFASSLPLLDSDGNLVVAGGKLTKLSALGDTIWSHSYRIGTSPYQGLSQVVELPNGQYLAAGSWRNIYDKDLSLFLIDHNGVLLRDTLLVRYGSNETAAGVGFTPGGNYVIGLSIDNYIAYNPQPLYAQLWACLRSWARLLPTRPGQPEPQNRLIAYPNPATDEVTLTGADEHLLVGHWELFDLLGRSVQAGRLSGLVHCSINLRQQPAGLYQLRITDERRATTQTLRLEKQ